ncbi:hypothetical protein GCM10009864_54700 [Streptomyces lunalinharesii]|uniref:Uncharacterized protein n=1 Tax=Streptomyces lunalinharesii TaxID=333384 RepID=A0ABN3SGB8_9ACTN
MNFAAATVGEGLLAALDEPEGVLSPELLPSEPEHPATSSTGTAAQVRRLASRLADRCMVPSLFVVVESVRTLVERAGPAPGAGLVLGHGTRRSEGGGRFITIERWDESGDS